MFGLSKPQPKAKGAALAQAQNQAPDSIPGMFKPGEFVLPPDTVHAMGGKQALQGVVDATHAQVPVQLPAQVDGQARGLGLKPEVFFANGGAPEDQLAKSAPSPGNTFPGNRLPGDSGFSSAPVAAPAEAPAPAPASARTSPGIFPGNRLQGDSGFSGAPIARTASASAPAVQDPGAQLKAIADQNSRGESYGSNAPNMANLGLQSPKPAQASAPAAVPATATAPAATRTPGASELYMQDRTQEMGDQWKAGNYAQAAGTAGRTAVQGLGMYGLELADKALTPAGNAIGGFAKGLFGLNEAQAAGAPATTPAASTAATPAAPAGYTHASQGVMGPPNLSTLASPGVNAGAATTSATQSKAGTEVSPGVYNHGRGQYSDQAGGMGLPSGFTGKPSAQSDAAASALAQSGASGFGLRSPVPTAAPEAPGLGMYGGRTAEAANQPGWSGSIGQSTGNGNMWSRTPEQQRRDAETQASSIHRQTAANGAAALRGLDGREMEAMRGTNALQQEQMRQAGGLQRTAITEAGATGRAALAESGASSRASGQLGLGLRRLTLDQQRASSEDRLREPQIRAAERMGQMQEAYINAETPEQKAAIASQMRAYGGKDDADWKVQVTPATKNVDGSTTAGSVIRWNTRDGDVQDVTGVGGKASVPAKDSLKAGQVYQTQRGQARWNGAEFELIG